MAETVERSSLRQVPCPACGRPTLYAPGNPYRPFCSAQCRQHDLGDWASERFRLPDTRPPSESSPTPQ